MQISDLPSTTTFDDNTVLAIENAAGGSNVASKVTGATLKTSLAADTGWTSLTLLNGVTGNIAYRVRSGVIYIVGTALNTSSSSTSITAANIPSDIRPTIRWTVKPTFPTYANNTYINIPTTGNIDIINNTGGSISNLYFTTAAPI